MFNAVAKKTEDNPTGVGRNPRGTTAALKRLTIRVTPDEIARYTAAAKATSLSVAEWIRAACEAALKRGGRKVRS
jgi:predicted HicB family RNase H-like nuclease